MTPITPTFEPGVADAAEEQTKAAAMAPPMSILCDFMADFPSFEGRKPAAARTPATLLNTSF